LYGSPVFVASSPKNDYDDLRLSLREALTNVVPMREAPWREPECSVPVQPAGAARRCGVPLQIAVHGSTSWRVGGAGRMPEATIRPSCFATIQRVPMTANRTPGTDCVFCEIVAGTKPASVIAEDGTTMAFLDLRQFHPGHVLVIPRRHVADIRSVDDATASAVMLTTARVARAVDRVFPGDGLSVWHSAGEGANQEVPHLHFHVHPRRFGDDVLRVYPSMPAHPAREVLDGWAEALRAVLRGA
jgi:histidine triad (HIT) family protein